MSPRKKYPEEEVIQALDTLAKYQDRETQCFAEVRYLRRSLIYFLQSKSFIEALVYTDKISDIYKSLIFDFRENCLFNISTYLDISANLNDRELYESFMKDYYELTESYLKYRLIYNKILGFFK